MSSLPQIPPSQMSKYPGMRPREGQVFRLWLQQHEAEYDYFAYNVRVGPGRDPGAGFPDNIRKSAIMGSQQRLDAVGWKAGTPTLIEIKDYALDLSIGQLLEYAALWAKAYPYEKPARLLIICSNHVLGFVERAAAAGVQVAVLLPH